MMKHRKLWKLPFAGALIPIVVGACTAGEQGNYVEITGGGFIFNYRAAEAYYGLIAEPLRELPDGAVLIAEFEDPAGGGTIIVRQPAYPGRVRFSLQTPSVTGVVKGRDYHAVVRLEDAQGATLEQHERSFRSNLDQAVLPEKPLTIGPGYQRNPANR